jgi:hypothetical protein
MHQNVEIDLAFLPSGLHIPLAREHDELEAGDDEV